MSEDLLRRELDKDLILFVTLRVGLYRLPDGESWVNFLPSLCSSFLPPSFHHLHIPIKKKILFEFERAVNNAPILLLTDTGDLE